MIKTRIQAITFILLTSIILLANIAISFHHHHESEVCVIYSHCESDGDLNNHKETNHMHDHQSGSKTDFCKLDQVYLIPTNQIKPEIKIIDYSENKDNYSQSHKYIERSVETEYYTGFIECIDPPASLLSYTSFVNHSIGLRAPPII